MKQYVTWVVRLVCERCCWPLSASLGYKRVLLEEKRRLANTPAELSCKERYRLSVINALLGNEPRPAFDRDKYSLAHKAKAKRLIAEAIESGVAHD